MPIRSEILLRDNALPHTTALTQEKLNKSHWKTLEHPRYSPDLLTYDYYLFGPFKEELGGHHFDDDDDVETSVPNWSQAKPNSFFDDEIKKLSILWEKRVNKRDEVH